MATAKKSTPTAKLTAVQARERVDELQKKLDKFESTAFCLMCKKHKDRIAKFYVNTDPMYGETTCTPICRECARKIALRVDKQGHEHEPTKESVILALKYLQKPFLDSVWNSSIQETENLVSGKVKTNVWAAYIKNIQMTRTLNGNIDAKRGMRGTVIFDESGFLSDEMMNVYGAFAVVNKSLKTGKDIDGNSIDPIRQRCLPRDLSYQKYYISSASSTDTQFWRLYRDFSKQQIMGNPDYCVLHIDCEQAFKPTLRGELVTPLLSRNTVESEMRTNPEKARREYYCIFTTDAGTDAIIRRGVITRNEETRKPLLYNDTGDKKFVITYDPARSRDNSVILVGEIYEYEQVDGSIDTRMRLVNCINLIDVA